MRLASALADRGTTVAFGLPGGGPNLDLVGAFEAHGIDFVLAHAETAACIMAATWGWLADGVTAAVVTRGPGAASAVNGGAQATLDRQPLLLVTDTVPASSRERVPHQRIDQQALLAPVCKASGVVGSGTTAADVTRAADIATSWPPGCVHLDYDTSVGGTVVAPAGSPTPGEVPAAAEARRLIAAAERPVVIAGVGVIPAAAEIRSALTAFGAPVFTTYQAVGTVPAEGPLSAGLFTNGASERPLLEGADLIITIGLDMVEPIPAAWTYDASVVALATAPTTDPYLPIQVEVVGDLARLVVELLEAPSNWPSDAGRRHRESVRTALASGESSDVFGPVALTTTLARHAPSAATVTVDAGAHFLAIMPFWPVEQPRRLLISNGLATMGYAVPAAIGAALARPGEPVIALTGDGGLGMCLTELETIVRRELPILVVVFDDTALSLIEIKQQPHHGGTGAVHYQLIDFAAVAQAMGMPATVVTDVAALTAALDAYDHTSPMLIDARIDAGSYPHLLAATRGT